ncbi:MAG: dolichol kinase [Candidatus Kapabacteria bacterium]|nr:dolichol kinase [Candidatus Kapabacteria bacterium]MDW8012220.1 dolichol kinase [Bacteroidota bacterium]
MHHADDIPFQSELVRKAIHLLSLSIPVGYIFVSQRTALTILLPLMVAFVVVDILMHTIPAIRQLFLQLFGFLLRPHELETQRLLLNGASYVMISACICIALFPKVIAVTAFAILILSDIASALVGKAWGRRRFLDKTAEGSAAFLVMGWVVVTVLGITFGAPWTYYVAGFLGAAVGTLAEAASIRLRMDDNLAIPLSIGATMWLLGWLAGLWGWNSFLQLLL